MSTRDTAARVRGVSWCAKNQNRTRTHSTHFKSTAGLPAPILNPRWSKNIGTPSFPKDHSNISPRKTPDSVGVRPCRHWGSGKHWDNECRHSRKGEKLARVNCIQLEDNDLKAQDDYDNLFYELESDSEEGSDQQDFCSPSSVLTFLTNRVSPIWNHWRKHLAWREPKVLTYLWVRKLLSLRI